MKAILLKVYFFDLQKDFDTICHNILKKLDHYGITGISNKQFESYLIDRKQSVSINGFNSDISTVIFGDPQGSVLELLLFLYIYINERTLAVKPYQVRHFADDTNLLNINKSPKRLNKLINIDSIKYLQMSQKPKWFSKKKKYGLQSLKKIKWKMTY